MKHNYIKKAFSRALFGLFGLVIKEIRVAPRQFISWNPLSILRTFWLIILSVSKLATGRSLRASYSFTGEDRLIESLLKKSITYNGFYVDVGCNHPVFLSNTYLFYRRGWRGISIDANANLIKKFRWYRPRDRVAASLVSNGVEPMEFMNLTNNVLSTVHATYINDFLEQGQEILKKEVMQPRTLSSILNELQCPHEFDFLSIDVEGHDWNVIRSIDLTKYKPELIVAELNPEPDLVDYLGQ
ncbi:MAG: FkbM family methyltransferase, partial [Bacteroidota bacterium]